MVILPSKLRWSIIALALIMMVSSVMISARMVHKNDVSITALQSDVRGHNELIRSLWQNSIQQENRLHMLALYTTLTHDKDDEALKKFAQDFARQFNPQTTAPITPEALPDMLAQMNERKSETITRIDQIFIEKQSWEEKISRLTQKNIFYMSLALFAQLLSIATITIVRDLK